MLAAIEASRPTVAENEAEAESIVEDKKIIQVAEQTRQAALEEKRRDDARLAAIVEEAEKLVERARQVALKEEREDEPLAAIMAVATSVDLAEQTTSRQKKQGATLRSVSVADAWEKMASRVGPRTNEYLILYDRPGPIVSTGIFQA